MTSPQLEIQSPPGLHPANISIVSSYHSTNTITTIMAHLKIILILVILAVCLLEQGEARPRAQIVGNHIMKRHRSVDKKITGNKTGKKWRAARRHHGRQRLHNRNLLKSLLLDYVEDYAEAAEELDYESPIIEIRFKREAAEEEVTRNNVLEDDILVQKLLTRK